MNLDILKIKKKKLYSEYKLMQTINMISNIDEKN